MKTFRFEDTDPDNFRTAAHDYIVSAFAAVSVMDYLLWEHKTQYIAWHDPAMEAETARINERKKALGKLYFERFRERCFIVSFHGCLSDDDDRSHYDTEEVLKKEWTKDQISCASESGWFVVDTVESVKDEVEEFLRSMYPSLEFSVEVHDDPEDCMAEYHMCPPMLGLRSTNKKWLSDREMVVDYVLPSLTPKSEEVIANILVECKKHLKQTGLPVEEALKRLQDMTKKEWLIHE